jgi:PAS domain S-box-containing protein
MTPRLYMRSASKEPLDLYGELLAQAPFAAWAADRDGRILFFNEAMRQLLGTDDADHLLSTYNIFEDEAAAKEELVPAIKRVLTGQIFQTVSAAAAGLGGDDGNESYVRCVYFPLKAEEGGFDGIGALTQDVTREYVEELSLSQKAHELEAAHEGALAEIARAEKRVRALKKQLEALRVAV